MGPKVGVFWSKTPEMTGCHIRGKNQSANSIMGKNTPQAMKIDALDTLKLYLSHFNGEFSGAFVGSAASGLV